MAAASPDSNATGEPARGFAATTLIAALGVVYGDIGTSPLYALRESLVGDQGTGVDAAAVLGVLSMIFWSLTLVVSVKYVLVVLRADNEGEGGILALMAAVLRQMPARARHRTGVVVAGLVGAAMFYGDSVLTPAVSVLSAVEGLEVVSPHFKQYVLPLSLVILIALFFVQRRGPQRVGQVFGPVMLVWFAVIALLGVFAIARNPVVLAAVSPGYALDFFLLHPGLTFAVLASVFLAVTGGEALYADMGHFGRTPIQVAWFWLVFPALVLNYFGQGALVLADAGAARNPFFLLAPSWAQLPLVLLATMATVIASQAVISGAFSLTSQAIKLGYLPRMEILFTSTEEAGQVYVPFVNWLLLVAVVLVVVGFGSSSALAGAYGIAVCATMTITTLGVAVVARRRWDWTRPAILALFVPLLLLDLSFVASNLAVKIFNGGWFPLTFAVVLFLLLATWKRGRTLVTLELERSGIALEPFLKSLQTYPPLRVPGTAVYMAPDIDQVPHALLHNLKHNKVLHERVIFMSATTENIPRILPASMAQVRDLGDGCWYVRVKLGFQDPVDFANIVRVLAREHDFELELNETSFFLSRLTVQPAPRSGMMLWRGRMFSWMLRNAQPASDYFQLPPNRVIEIGTQVSI